MKTAKTVTVLARYFIKRLALVCYSVRNGDNKEYCVTINPRKNTASCTCEGNSVFHKQCYHIKHCLEVEAARNVSKNVQIAPEVVTSAPVSAPVVVQAPAPVKATERRLIAPLYRQAFSLTR